MTLLNATTFIMRHQRFLQESERAAAAAVPVTTAATDDDDSRTKGDKGNGGHNTIRVSSGAVLRVSGVYANFDKAGGTPPKDEEDE